MLGKHSYVEAVQTGNLLFLSGMLPAIGHEPKFVGRLAKELDANTGRQAGRIADPAVSTRISFIINNVRTFLNLLQ